MFFDSDFVQICMPWIGLEVFYTHFEPFHRGIPYVCNMKKMED